MVFERFKERYMPVLAADKWLDPPLENENPGDNPSCG